MVLIACFFILTACIACVLGVAEKMLIQKELI